MEMFRSLQRENSSSNRAALPQTCTGIMAVILLTKALPWIGQYVHRASIAGFLFVLGVFVTFATNIAGAISIGGSFAGPYGFGPAGMVIGASAFVTAKFNPFYGLVAGFLTHMIMMGA